MTARMDFKAHILARARKIQSEYEERLAEAVADLEKTDEFKAVQGIKELLSIAKQDVQDADMAFRVEAKRLYDEVQDKNAHPSFVVKTFSTLDYDEGAAIEWCWEHMRTGLKLNKGAFEKVAKVMELAFITFGSEDRVQAYKDLSEFENIYLEDESGIHT